ncbi:flagellin [Dyella jejuensis]
MLRMKDLATQAADGSSNEDDRGALQAEFDALGAELYNIVSRTSYGGQKLLDSTDGVLKDKVTFQIGASSAEQLDLDVSTNLSSLDTKLQALSASYSDTPPRTSYGGQKLLDSTDGVLKDKVTFQIGASSAEQLDLDVSTNLSSLDTKLQALSASYSDTPPASAGTEIADGSDANSMIDKIGEALDAVGTLRSALGAVQNRLEHTNNNLANMVGNTTDAEGRIMDVDYASESANMSSQQILLQASTAMLKQASSMNQMVLSLIQ